MIEVRKVHYAYPGQSEALKDVSACFRKGEFTAILGPNGSGKSTLLKTVCRLISPHSGEVLLEGRAVKAMKQKELAARIALMSQHRQIPAMTVRDLVACGRYPHQSYMRGLDEKDELAIDQAMKTAQVEMLQERMVSRLSGGQQQRAYIAMALAQDTDVLCLDEPTSSLDIHVRFDVMELISRLRDEGKTVIAVLHDLELALAYADRLIVLDHGEKAADGTAHEITESGVLDRVFGIRTKTFREGGKPYYHFEQAQKVNETD